MIWELALVILVTSFSEDISSIETSPEEMAFPRSFPSDEQETAVIEGDEGVYFQ